MKKDDVAAHQKEFNFVALFSLIIYSLWYRDENGDVIFQKTGVHTQAQVRLKKLEVEESN